MKTFNEIYQELISHPDFIYGEIIDKETVIDQIYDEIGNFFNYDLEDKIMDELSEKWYEDHRESMKNNFDDYFTMGEKYYYLTPNYLKLWLEDQKDLVELN